MPKLPKVKVFCLSHLGNYNDKKVERSDTFILDILGNLGILGTCTYSPSALIYN